MTEEYKLGLLQGLRLARGSVMLERFRLADIPREARSIGHDEAVAMAEAILRAIVRIEEDL
jgi:hypothetical protein